MIVQLTPAVWWGNWESPLEVADQVKFIINVATFFRRRRPYWRRMDALPPDMWYLRLAKGDRESIDDAWKDMLTATVQAAMRQHKVPILCHCQMGGHRGPSTALAVAHELENRRNWRSLHKRALELHPNLARGRRFYRSIVRWREEVDR